MPENTPQYFHVGVSGQILTGIIEVLREAIWICDIGDSTLHGDLRQLKKNNSFNAKENFFLCNTRSPQPRLAFNS